jgi:hypothetical protein
MPKLHYSRATTGEKVAECLLDPADAGLIGDLVSAAMQQGAGLLCTAGPPDPARASPPGPGSTSSGPTRARPAARNCRCCPMR